MSLQRSVIASVASQVYVTLASVVLVPLYLRFMGAEAYGLVGFFSMVQMWFGLLDLGLTPTLVREAARQRGGALDAATYRGLVHALELIFAGVAVIGGLALFAAARPIATSWLKVEALGVGDVIAALQLMGPIFALRWMAGLYRGALSGAEQIVWLSTFNAVVATLRFAGVVPLLAFVDASPVTFFIYQLVVSALETLALALHAYRQLPPLPPGTRAAPRWSHLRSVWGFSLSVAFAGMVGVCITQTDKLVLSSVLPLAEYAHFTLAVLVASAVLILSGPVGNALTPRIARLQAEGATDQLLRTYRDATQVVAALAGATAITLALQAEALLWAWTGDATLASTTAPVLSGYALGNAVLALAAFPYYLQFAKGNLRLHVLGNVVFLVLFVPAILVAAYRWGGSGAAIVWLGTNLLLLLGWVPLVHHRFAPGLNPLWFGRDSLAIVLFAAAAAAAASAAVGGTSSSRLQALLGTVVVAITAFAAAGAASSKLRSAAITAYRRMAGGQQ